MMGSDVKALEQQFLTPDFFSDMPQKYIDDTHEEAPAVLAAVVDIAGDFEEE